MDNEIKNRTPKIMIVDDSALDLRLAGSILKAHKFRVQCVQDARRILKLLDAELPDLILLDMMMPGISGIEVCRQLKREERYRDIPILFLSGASESDMIVSGFEAGAQDYVLKPVNPKELLARIETHLTLKFRTDELIEANRKIERFNHILSHDIKNPIWSLRKLLCYLEEDLGDKKTPSNQELLELMKDKATAVLQMTDRYLEFARLPSGISDLERVDLGRIIDQTVQELQLMHETRKIDATREPMPEVEGDPILLKTVFQNLLSNAVKFSANREIIRIHIGLESDSREHILTVRDNGVGFDMAYAGNLFDFMARMHSQKDFEGTGAGLAIVKKIIALHGGRVWIDSKEDEGTTVYVALPKV